MKRPVVVKAGGELVGLRAVRRALVRHLVGLHRSGPVVFVHGGGPQIEAELQKNGVSARFVKGRRLTSPAAMAIIERVLSGEINKGLAAELAHAGVPAVGLSGRDGAILTGDRIPGLQRTARPASVDPRLLTSLLQNRFLPVISSVASDRTGGAVNINADDAAAALAIRLKARNLILVTNISGVLDASKKRIPILKIGAIDRLIRDGVITGGMIPKVESARVAIRKGVGEVDIVNGKHDLSLSSGTRIVP